MFRRVAVSLMATLLTGCITSAGGNLQPIELDAADYVPTVEHTVGDFEFTLEGGKMVTSNKMGRILNDEIMRRWVEQGLVAGHSYVPSSQFTGTADFNITLSGSQYGDSSVVMQILSGATLFLLPYTVDSKFDLQYVVENVRTGEKYSASVEDSYHTTVELLLFLAAPVASRGERQTMNALADHLYQQVRDEGAFLAPSSPQ